MMIPFVASRIEKANEFGARTHAIDASEISSFMAVAMEACISEIA
jgi:hypothetical protein